jgi:hypothetical protein
MNSATHRVLTARGPAKYFSARARTQADYALGHRRPRRTAPTPPQSDPVTVPTAPPTCVPRPYPLASREDIFFLPTSRSQLALAPRRVPPPSSRVPRAPSSSPQRAQSSSFCSATARSPEATLSRRATHLFFPPRCLGQLRPRNRAAATSSSTVRVPCR